MKINIHFNNNQEQIFEFQQFNYKISTLENSDLMLRIINIEEEYDFKEKIILYDLYNLLMNNTINNIIIYSSLKDKMLFNLEELKLKIKSILIKEDVNYEKHSQAFIEITLLR